MLPNFNEIIERQILIMGVQQLEDTFSILLRNMRSWLSIVGLGANDEVVNNVRREDVRQ